jgi:hypothetical protein
LRTITVKEAAAALGITPRAVSYRLEKGQLKGTLSKNEATGVPEWRIYPNKEILAGLNQATTGDTSQIDFEPNDVIDAESIDDSSGIKTTQQSAGQPGADFQSIVEQCVRPLVEEVKAQALELAEKDRIIAEKDAQLKLLPDFEKQKADLLKRIEEERMSAEIQFAKAAEKEQEAEQLTAENERLKQKAEEAALSLEKLQLLEKQMQELKQPWWRKLFSAPGEI